MAKRKTYITIKRRSAFFDSTRTLDITLDDQLNLALPKNEEKYVEISAVEDFYIYAGNGFAEFHIKDISEIKRIEFQLTFGGIDCYVLNKENQWIKLNNRNYSAKTANGILGFLAVIFLAILGIVWVLNLIGLGILYFMDI